MIKMLIFFFIIFAFSSCTSISVYQNAKTLPKGTGQIGMGIGGGKVKNEAKIPGFDSDLPSLTGDIWGRYGFSDKIDAGLKLSLFGSLGTDIKYGIKNEEKGHPFSIAAGLSYAFSSASSKSGTRKDKTTIQDLLIPIYISKDFSKRFTGYIVPRYGKRFTSNKRTDTGIKIEENFNSDMLGYGGGIILNLGKENYGHFILEYHRLFKISNASYYSQVAGAAISFEF